MATIHKWPLEDGPDYRAHTGCGGNCDQGRRPCDCVPNLDEDTSSMGEGAGALVWPLLVALVLLVGVLAHAWGLL